MDARHYSEMHLAKCRREKISDMDVWQELFNQTFM
jgi:PII interaction protein X